MMIGSRERFAIEYAYVRGWVTEGQKWLYGHICFWAGGKRLGDFDDTVTLGVAIAEGNHILSHRGTRCDPELMSKSAQESFRIMDNALYEDDERTLEEIEADGAKYWRFAVHALTEAFDRWKVYLVEDELRARLIWRQLHDDDCTVHEAILLPGEFDDILEAVVQELQRMHDEFTEEDS
jgi:hypothetical protein